MATPTALLASERLGRNVLDFLDEQRAHGASWAKASIALYEATGLIVSYEALRTWYSERAA